MRSGKEFGFPAGTAFINGGVVRIEPDEPEDVQVERKLYINGIMPFIWSMLSGGLSVGLFGLGWGSLFVFCSVAISVWTSVRLQIFILENER